MTDFEARLRKLKAEAEAERNAAEVKKATEKNEMAQKVEVAAQKLSEYVYRPVLQISDSMKRVGISSSVSNVDRIDSVGAGFRLTTVFGHIDFTKKIDSQDIQVQAVPTLGSDNKHFHDSEGGRLIKLIETWVEENNSF